MELYNSVGMYPGLQVPTAEVLGLGVKLHTVEDYIREKLLPYLLGQTFASQHGMKLIVMSLVHLASSNLGFHARGGVDAVKRLRLASATLSSMRP